MIFKNSENQAFKITYLIWRGGSIKNVRWKHVSWQNTEDFHLHKIFAVWLLLVLFMNISVAEIVAVVKVYYFLYNEKKYPRRRKNKNTMTQERANW